MKNGGLVRKATTDLPASRVDTHCLFVIVFGQLGVYGLICGKLLCLMHYYQMVPLGVCPGLIIGTPFACLI